MESTLTATHALDFSQTNLHSHHTALVDNLLNDASILADHLANQIARHLDRFLAVLEHGAGLFHRIITVAEYLERTRLLLQLNVGDAWQFAGILDVSTVGANCQTYQVFAHFELVREAANVVQFGGFQHADRLFGALQQHHLDINIGNDRFFAVGGRKVTYLLVQIPEMHVLYHGGVFLAHRAF